MVEESVEERALNNGVNIPVALAEQLTVQKLDDVD